MLALFDLLAVVIVSLTIGVFSGADTALWSALFTPIWLLLAKVHGLYDRDQRSLRHLTVDELPALFMWSVTGTAALSVLLGITPVGALDVKTALGVWIVAGVSAFFLRGAARGLWRRISPPERTVIIGRGPLADATRRKLELFPDIHVDLADQRESFTSDDLASGASWLVDVDRLILASQTIDEQLIAQLVAYGRAHGIKLSVVPPARGMFGTAVQLNHVADLPIVEYNTWAVSRSTLFLKRVLDATLSLLGLVAVLPLLLVIAIAIGIDSRGPVLFTQRRCGLGGRPFRMYKFRTMVSDAEERLSEVVSLDDLREPMFKLSRDPRVTRIGRLLRRTSLDELPQLLNVLKGEMSLVGPRPEQIELVERYRPEHRFRLDVKPGLTGPMQVYGRGRLTFDERLSVEREYIENLSLGRDLRIIAMTVAAVFSGRGAF